MYSLELRILLQLSITQIYSALSRSRIKFCSLEAFVTSVLDGEGAKAGSILYSCQSLCLGQLNVLLVEVEYV